MKEKYEEGYVVDMEMIQEILNKPKPDISKNDSKIALSSSAPGSAKSKSSRGSNSKVKQILKAFKDEGKNIEDADKE